MKNQVEICPLRLSDGYYRRKVAAEYYLPAEGRPTYAL